MLPRSADDALFFVTIADAGSLARAGRLLGIAPSTLSRRLTALEKRLGVLLIERSTRALDLTEVGKLYLDRARAAAAALAEADDIAASHGAAPRGTLRVAGPPTLGALLLGAAVARYRERCPDVRVDVVLSERPVHLRLERFEVAVRLGLAATEPSDIVRRIGASARTVCAAPGYLAQRQRPSRIDELGSHALIGLGSTHAESIWMFRRGAQRVAADVSFQVRVNSALLAREACVAGAGLALLPKALAVEEVRRGALVEVALELEPEAQDVQLLLAAASARTAKVRAFVDVLDELPPHALRWIRGRALRGRGAATT